MKRSFTTVLLLCITLAGRPASAATYLANVQQDTYIKQTSPSEKHGSDVELFCKAQPADTMLAVYQFDLSSIPTGATVASAVLELQVISADASGLPVRVYRITQLWTEPGADWNVIAPDIDRTTIHGSFIPATAGSVSVDLTNLVQDWIDGALPNHGLVLVSTSVNVQSSYTSKEWAVQGERPLLRVTISAEEPRIVTGTYTGDGTNDRLIAGLDFTPDVVIVAGENLLPAVIRTSTMTGDLSKLLGPADEAEPGLIKALLSVGFLLGSDAHVNQTGSQYYWTAIKAAEKAIAVGSYTGDGLDDRLISGIGFRPDYVMVMNQGSQITVHRFSTLAGDATLDLSANGSLPNRIQSLESDGFEVGSDPAVNESGILHHYVAFTNRPARIAVGTYTGDGKDDRKITGPGFEPEYLIIKSGDATAAAVHRLASMSGDDSQAIPFGFPTANAVQSFTASGFELGTHSGVNLSSRPYHWIALHNGRSLTADLDVGITAPSNAAEGDTFEYEVFLGNLGPDDATGIEVRDLLPTGVTYVSDSPSQGAYSSATGLWTVGALSALSGAQLFIHAVVDPGMGGSIITNTVDVISLNQTDPNSGNNTYSVDTAVKSSDFRVKTGYYQGDGQTDRTISGLGFQPDLVIVTGDNAEPSVVRSSTMASNLAKELGPNSVAAGNLVKSFSPDGFSIGSGVQVNDTGVDYYWVAFKAATDSMVVGSYTGDGQDDRNITSLGFQPAYLIIMSEASEKAMQRFTGELSDQSLPFDSDGEKSDRIQDFLPQGFQIGKHNTVNESGVTFHYAAWKAVPDQVSAGSYFGNGIGQDITTAGFRSDYAIVKDIEGNAGSQLRSASMTGDLTLPLAGGSAYSGGIQTFLPEGFRVGTDLRVNRFGRQFFWVAFSDIPSLDLALSKSIDNSFPNTGDTLSYRITVTNTGPEVATGIRATDYLPAGLSFVSDSTAQGSYNWVSGLWTIGDLAVADSATLSITVRVSAGTGGATIVNTARISASDQSDSNPANDQASVAIIVQSAELALSKGVDKPAPIEGDTIQYTISLSNDGPDSATGIEVLDLLPPGIAYLSDSLSQGAYNDTTGLWQVGGLADGGEASLFLRGRVAAGTGGQTIVNTAEISSADQEDPTPEENSAAAVLVVQHADLELSKAVGKVTPVEGDTLVYTISLVNLGPDSATVIVVRDVLPVGIAYLSDSTSQGVYDSGSGIWTAGTCPAGDSLRLTIQARVETGMTDSVITNTASILAVNQADLQPDNNADSIAVTVVRRPHLEDESGSLYPPSAVVGESALGLRIGLDNSTDVGVMLDTTSAVSFTDGARSFRAGLANPTYIPPYADNFTITFRKAAVPADISAPDYYDLTLSLAGTDDYANRYLESISTAGRDSILIDVHWLTVQARPLSAETVQPGARNRTLLALAFGNEYPDARSLDTLIVTNRSLGPGGQPDLDAEFDSLYLYDDVDANGLLSGPDQLLIGSPFSAGRAAFPVGGGWQIAGSDSRSLLVTASVDSFLARDGDRLDAAVMSTQDVVFIESTHIANTFGPPNPLDSFGYLNIDGMAAHQILLIPSAEDTLISGAQDRLLLTFTLPRNGYEADTLTGFAVRNLTGDFTPADFSAVHLYRDDSDAIFNPGLDDLIGDLVYSGDRYQISGIQSPIGSAGRFFLAVDVSTNPTTGHHFRPSIPLMGVEVTSANDGPVDRPADPGATFILRRVEKIEVTNTALPAVAAHPGGGDIPLLIVKIKNNTIEPVRLDTLTLVNTSVGPGTVADRDGEIERLRLYVDDGNGLVDSWDALLKDDLVFTGGSLTAGDIGWTLATAATEYLLITCDVDSFCSRDGDSLKVQLPAVSSLRFDPPKLIIGDFPMASQGNVLINGMMAFQVDLYPTADSLIATQASDILVFDFSIPANGYEADTLQTIQLDNEGSATAEHIARLALYADGGNGSFDPAGDDLYLGDFLHLGGKQYLFPDLNLPLTRPCGSATRLFAAVDLQETYSNGASIQFKLPVLGIEVASGNDGPIDAELINPSIVLIPKPNELTIFPYSVADKRVFPDSRNVLNFGIGCYNGFGTAFTMEKIRLFQVGTAVNSEIEAVYAFEDSDSNGLFDPLKDGPLTKGYYQGGFYMLNGIGLNLSPRRITYLFVAYDLSPAVRDSVGIDFQLNSSDHITLSNSSIEVHGEFPINSPGRDFSNGMIRSQINTQPAPTYRAALGEQDVLALSMKIPANGSLIDRLHWLAVQNTGSAVAGGDISILKLWTESGAHPNEFNAGEDLFVAFLAWNGSAWRNSTILNEIITTSGLQCYVTFSAAAAASDGATFKGKIPVGGIDVASGNDGPLDGSIINPYVQTISADPLLTELYTDRDSYSIGQSITLNMKVRNAGSILLSGIRPSDITLEGAGDAQLLVEPVPTGFDLVPKADTVLSWTYSAEAAGQLGFCGFAYDGDSTKVSVSSCTDSILIQNNPTGVAVNIFDTAPAGANRGQDNIPLFKLGFSYRPSDTLSASILFDRIQLNFVDGAANPIAPGSVLESFSLVNPQAGPLNYALADSADNPISLNVAPAVMFQPGDSLVLDAYGSISDTADFTSFKLVFGNLADISLLDGNSFSALSNAAGPVFPWSTNEITINAPADTMVVTVSGPDTIWANFGQDRVAAWQLHLVNNGALHTAGELLTDISFRFYDRSGAAVPPGTVINKLTLATGQDEVFIEDAVPSTGNQLHCDLTNPLLVQPGFGRTLEVRLDMKTFPPTGGFYITVNDPLSITARDFNAGHLIDIVTGGPAGFPLASPLILFQAPASGAEVVGLNLTPPIVMPSQQAVPLMSLIVSHPDTAGAASIELDSLTIGFSQTGGHPLFPGGYFSSLYVTCGDETLSITSSLSSITPMTGLKLRPSLQIHPAGSETLQVFVDTKNLYPAAVFEAKIDRQDMVLFDTNDHNRIYAVAGDFPIGCGPAALQIPSTDADCGLESKLPGNIRATEENVHVFDLLARNGNPPGSTDIEIGEVNVVIENMKGAVLDPSAFLSGARLYDGDSLVSTGSISTSLVTLSLPGGRAAVAAGRTDTLHFFVDVKTVKTGENIRFSIPSASALEIREAVTDSLVSIQPAGGGSFPLKSEPTHILGAGAEDAFTNYPNPFAAGRAETRITFYLEQPSRVTMKIYSLWGAPVVTLLSGKRLEPGLHQEVTWDGRNGDGDVVNNGVYYLRLEVNPAGGAPLSLQRKVGVLR